MLTNQSETNIETINERLLFLHCVLNACQYSNVLTVGEKICINQERGSLYDMINFLNGELESETLRTYKVPESIEIILDKIKPKIFNIYNI